MKITHDEVRRIARLAHLRFEEADLDRLRTDLDRILAYMGSLDRLDTSDVEPAVSVAAGPPGAARPDRVAPTLATERALSNAPESHRGHFKVPKVIS